MTRILAPLIVIIGSLIATAAHAATGITAADLNMRRGPGVSYARITVIPARQALTIEHCTRSGRWCLVRWRGYRGWVSARYLRFAGARTRLVVPPPYILFDYGYRDRRWHKRHDRWHRVRPYPRKKIKRPRWNRDHDRWHGLPPKRRRTTQSRNPQPGTRTRRFCPPGDRRCR